MLKVKPFRQHTGLCGPACLKMVLGYFGVEKSERELVRLVGATEVHGAKARQLISAAKQLGCSAWHKDNADIADLRELVIKKKIPVIVDWFSQNDGHYSVVIHLDKKNIYLQDPELGRVRVMKLKIFKRVWFDFPGEFLRAQKDIIIRRIMIIKPKGHLSKL